MWCQSIRLIEQMLLNLNWVVECDTTVMIFRIKLGLIWFGTLIFVWIRLVVLEKTKESQLGIIYAAKRPFSPLLYFYHSKTCVSAPNFEIFTCGEISLVQFDWIGSLLDTCFFGVLLVRFRYPKLQHPICILRWKVWLVCDCHALFCN